MTEYRCRIGHIYSPKSALVVHAEREENTLWLAAVLLEEGAELAEEISNQASVSNPEHLKMVSAAKRNLAERLKRVVSDFVEIPMHLDQSCSGNRIASDLLRSASRENPAVLLSTAADAT